MPNVFPEPITMLPLAAIPLEGVKGYLLQGERQHLLFMEFSKDLELPEHSHEAQWGVVLEGRINLVIDGDKHMFAKGDRYFIPEGVNHSARIYAGYVDITYFDDRDRYDLK